MAVVDRSDADRQVSLSVGYLFCRPDRIVVEFDLCRPVPVASAKTYFELARAGRRDCVPGAMAVYQALQFREELLADIHLGSSFTFPGRCGAEHRSEVEKRGGTEDQDCSSLSTKAMAVSCQSAISPTPSPNSDLLLTLTGSR